MGSGFAGDLGMTLLKQLARPTPTIEVDFRKWPSRRSAEAFSISNWPTCPSAYLPWRSLSLRSNLWCVNRRCKAPYWVHGQLAWYAMWGCDKLRKELIEACIVAPVHPPLGDPKKSVDGNTPQNVTPMLARLQNPSSK